jgi:hypothetical protein
MPLGAPGAGRGLSNDESERERRLKLRELERQKR